MHCVEQDERCSRFFFRRIARRKMEGGITTLRAETGETITGRKEINDMITSFYKTLYSSRPTTNNGFFNPPTVATKLSEAETQTTANPINRNELYQALKDMKTGKAPGSDGLTVQFYKRCWHVIAQPLLNCILESIEKGTLPLSMRQSIIKLLPKKDKDKKILKNWRPISLINVDTKIFSKLIANRLKIRLPKIVKTDQKAFVAGRQLHEGILNQRITIEHCLKAKNEGALVAIDFAKAFDSVEHSALWKALRAYGFSEYLSGLVKTLCKDAFSTVMNENFKLSDFPILRSCRQGDCVSPYLFVLVIEPLLQRIRDELPGVTI